MTLNEPHASYSFLNSKTRIKITSLEARLEEHDGGQKASGRELGEWQLLVVPADTALAQSLFVRALRTHTASTVHLRGIRTFCFSDEEVGA